MNMHHSEKIEGGNYSSRIGSDRWQQGVVVFVGFSVLKT
jgi:hypothetical protein